jgi:ribose transport system substrate-binding protein
VKVRIAAIAVTLTACLTAARAADPAAENLPKFKGGFSTSFLDSPFFVVLTGLTAKAAQTAGLTWLQPVNAQSHPGKQISDIQTLVNSGVKGLIVVPRDSDAIAPALKYAASKSVAVVAIDVGINTGKAAMTVRADNVGMAQRACEAVGAALQAKGKALELQGDLLNSSGRERTEGLESCMKQKYPNIQVIARPTRWESARAADATQTMLTAHPDIGAIYMQSGDIMLGGVLSILRQAGRKERVGERNRIFLISINGSPYELERIRAGELDAAVSQPLNLYAQFGVEYLQRAVKGDTFAPGPTAHGSRIVRNPAGNLEDLVSASVVTKKNVDDPTLWGNMAGAYR